MTAIATRPLSDSTDSLLRFALRLDATLTGLLGLGIAAMADPMARLTGLTAGPGVHRRRGVRALRARRLRAGGAA